MSVTYKDIGQLSQKSSIAGTEKIVVSDTQYITPAQIAATATPTVDTALSSSSTNAVQNKVIKAEFDKVVYLGTPTGDSASAADPLVGVSMNGSPVTVTDGVAVLGTVITSLSGYATESYVDGAIGSALGDIETLLAAI